VRVIPAADIVEHERGGNRMSGLATPSRGAAELMVWRTVLAPGGAPPPHSHDHEEICVVLRGTGVVREPGSRESRFGPGDVIVAPAGAVHEVRADDGVECEWVAALPAGTRTFRADGSELEIPWAS
jgi:quercetin dioxygenase-like cupin family protein